MARRLGPMLLVCFLASGCAWFEPAHKRMSSLRSPFAGSPFSSGDDMITLDLAVIERPAGDDFLNKELWKSTDDMILDLDTKAHLAANGIRVGQVVGLTPSALQTLLRSERYCVNPRRRVIAPGSKLTHICGPAASQAYFTIHDAGRATPVSLDQARFCLDIVASRGKENHVRLAFTPRVETGERMLPFQPDVERSTWTVRVEKPSRAFPEVAWEVSLAPNRMLVMGALVDRPQTLGQCTFTEPGVHRLLVLRASAAAKTGSQLDPALEELWRTTSSPPLALQAALTGRYGR